MNEILASDPLAVDTVVTTIDVRLQALIERLTHRYIAAKRIIAVSNTAVLLVDTRDMGIKALLGLRIFSISPLVVRSMAQKPNARRVPP